MAAQIRVLRQRIRSVQSTKKITRAFELIATSRIAKAQQRVNASKPYAEAITRAVTAVASQTTIDHPLVTARVIASAYGLEALTRCCALAMRDVAISSNARVIFLVDCTDLMRWRRTRIWAA